MRAAPPIALALLALAGCRGEEPIPLAMCPDDGSCFDEVDSERPPPRLDLGGGRDARVDVGPGLDLAVGDMASDGMSDGMLDGMTDGAIPDGMSDGTADGMTDIADGMADIMPDIADGMVDGMPSPDMALADMIPGDTALADAALDPDRGPIGPVERCEEANTVECFGHPDCPADERCEDIGGGEDPVPCCVPGRRGALPAGASCAEVDGQIECASGVCIEGADDAICSTPCDSPADCPPSLPRCIAFPFGDTAFDWCFPD